MRITSTWWSPLQRAERYARGDLDADPPSTNDCLTETALVAEWQRGQCVYWIS